MEKRDFNDYPNITSTTSATDTTGLIPTPPRDNDERESYEELAGLEIPRNKKKKKW